MELNPDNNKYPVPAQLASSYKFDAGQSNAVLKLASKYKTSPDVIFLSIYQFLLSTFFNKQDIVVGLVVNNRLEKEGGDKLFGLHLNTIPIRQHIYNKTAKELILKTVENKNQVYQYKLYPYGKIKSDLNSNKDIYNCAFNYVHFHISEDQYEKNAVSDSDGFEKTNIPLMLHVSREKDSFSFEFKGDNKFIDKNTISRLKDYFVFYFNQLNETDRDDFKLKRIIPEEYQQITQKWNNTDTDFPADKSLIQLFEEQVVKKPNNISVIFKNKKLTYKELNNKADQLAEYIISENEIKPNELMALFLDRGLEMLIGILAVLKTGATYVPIDPDYPAERIKYILDDTKSKTVLTKSRLADKLQKISNSKLIKIDKLNHQNKIKPSFKRKSTSFDNAYIIYTSGTTGNPKGVIIQHKSAVNTINFLKKVYRLSDKDNVTEFTSYVFDVSVSEIFAVLTQGAVLHILSNDVRYDTEKLAKYLIDNNISYTYLPPVLLSRLPKKEFPKLKSIIYAGEPCSAETAKYWGSKVDLFNIYGPTETTIYSLCKKINYDEVKQIGKPIDNNKVYITGYDNNLVPVGVIGELYIGGIGLAKGYLNKPELTSEKFVTNPFKSKNIESHAESEKVYKTGDLARWLPDGNIEYFGRNDFQVKIRGYRIELSEIEKVLESIDNIGQACVKVYEKNNNKYIVGYYVSDINLNEKEIQQKIAKQLPDYMIPSVLIRMKHFPLTINGKLDKKALPEPNFKNKISYTAPKTSLEKKLCNVWKEVLKLKKIGITDNFFNIGGNSILSINLVYKMNSILSENNIEFSITDLFKHKTIKNLLSNIKSNEMQIKTLAVSENENNQMFFIHPGGTGCEVYTGLANKIKDQYNCYGIDNYNILNKDNIRSLNLLAEKYVNNLIDFGLDNEINLCGWSLGGKIALEIGYLLEKKGYKNINIFLFDTVILDVNLQSLFENAFDDSYNNKIKNNLANEGYNEKYINKIITAMKSEDSISKQIISGNLQYAKVTLFKAIQEDKRMNYKGRTEINMYIQSLKYNNAEKFAKNIKTVALECHHGNIIDYLISNRNQLLS